MSWYERWKNLDPRTRAVARTTVIGGAAVAVLAGAAHEGKTPAVEMGHRHHDRAVVDRVEADAGVRAVQGTLKELGYYHGALDGMNGPGTQGAIMALQHVHGLTEDGVYGPKTAKAAHAELAEQKQGTAKRRRHVSAAERALDDVGESAGTIVGTALAAPVKAVSELFK